MNFDKREEANRQFCAGNSAGAGYNPGCCDDGGPCSCDPNGLSDVLGELVAKRRTDGEVAIYCGPLTGDYVAVGDVYGPWAVDVDLDNR